jgi:hypothetical protein
MEFRPGGVYRLSSGALVLCVYGEKARRFGWHTLNMVRIGSEVDTECCIARWLECRLNTETGLFELDVVGFEYVGVLRELLDIGDECTSEHKEVEAGDPPVSRDEAMARGLYGDRALSGPNALGRSIKDWG